MLSCYSISFLFLFLSVYIYIYIYIYIVILFNNLANLRKFDIWHDSVPIVNIFYTFFSESLTFKWKLRRFTICWLADEWNGVTGKCSRFGVRSMTVKLKKKWRNWWLRTLTTCLKFNGQTFLHYMLTRANNFAFKLGQWRFGWELVVELRVFTYRKWRF